MKSGIWIDSREAFVIWVDESTSKIETIVSGVEDFHPIGGSRSNVPYGPVDTVSEHKYQERKRHQQAGFFNEIIDFIRNEHEIVIFGPAQMKNKLSRKIEDRTDLNIKVLDCLPSDSITKNQKVAFVKKYYNLLKN